MTNKLQSELQQLKALLLNGIITRDWYYRELDEMIKYASNQDEIKMINAYKYEEE